MSIRVLLADDHQVVLDGLSGLLAAEADIDVVALATNGPDAVAQTEQHRPDVAVLDVTMPGSNGVSVARSIRRANEGTRVLALSMHGDRRFVVDMFRAGATGYVVKSSPIEDVLTAIRAVADGEIYLDAGLVEMVPEISKRKSRPRRQAALSGRESEVLQLVAEGKSSKEIAAALHVATKTVDWHRQSIMDKLGIRSIAELTKYAVRAGLTPLA